MQVKKPAAASANNAEYADGNAGNHGAWEDVPDIEAYGSKEEGTHGVHREFQRSGKLLQEKSRTRGASQYILWKCSGCVFKVRLHRKSDSEWRLQLRHGEPVHAHSADLDILDIPQYICDEVNNIVEDAGPRESIQPKSIFRDLGERYQREPYLQGKLGERTYMIIRDKVRNHGKKQNGPRIDTGFEFSRWKKSIAIELPPEYVPRMDYATKEDLAEALGLPSPEEMFVLEPSEKVIELVRSSSSDRKKADVTITESAILSSAADLFNVLDMMLNLPPEEWSIFGDGTHNITFDNQVVCVFVTVDVGMRITQNNKVTQSARPMITGWLGGERKDAVQLTVYVLVDWTLGVFGVQLTFPVTVSDLADAFVNRFMEIFPDSTGLRCFPHVLRGLTQNSKAVSKLKDREANLPIIKEDIRRLHLSKSRSMFDALAPIVVETWREDLGETKYADHAQEYYFSERKCTWYVGASGTCIGSCDVCSKKLGCLGAWLIRFQESGSEMDFSVYQRSLGERRKGGKYGRQHYGGLRLAPNQVITVPESESIEITTVHKRRAS